MLAEHTNGGKKIDEKNIRINLGVKILFELERPVYGNQRSPIFLNIKDHDEKGKQLLMQQHTVA